MDTPHIEGGIAVIEARRASGNRADTRRQGL